MKEITDKLTHTNFVTQGENQLKTYQENTYAIIHRPRIYPSGNNALLAA